MRRLFSDTRNIARKLKGSVGKPSQRREYPPEVLQQVFVHCCGDEYIDFFAHSPIEGEIVRTSHGGGDNMKGIRKDHQLPFLNTAYILKAVSKEWKAIVETTPQLWQRLYFEFQIVNPPHSVHLSETQVAVFAQRYANVLKHVFMARSGGLSLHLRVNAGMQPGSEDAERLRGVFLKPLFQVLVEGLQRWESLEFLRHIFYPSGLQALLGSLNAEDGLTRATLPSLLQLSLSSPQDYEGTRISAPRLSKLVIRGAHIFGADTNRTISTFIRWPHITSLVLSVVFNDPTNVNLGESIRLFAEILKAFPKLEYFHWQGRLGGAAPGFPLTPIQPFVLESIRSITMEDSSLDFSRMILGAASCPQLETLQILVASPSNKSTTYQQVEAPQAVSSIEAILKSAAAIKSVTIVQCDSLSWSQGTFQGSAPEPPKLGYAFYSGTQTEYQAALRQDKRWSKLRQDSTLEKIPAEIMTVKSTARLPKKSRIPSLTVPINPLHGWAARDLHCSSEDRLTEVFGFISSLTKDDRIAGSASRLSESRHKLLFFPRELHYLIQCMEMVRSKQLPSDACCFTFAAIIPPDQSSDSMYM